MHEYVVALKRDGRAILACAGCGRELSAYDGSYKSGLLVHEGEVTLIPSAQDPRYYVDEHLVFRRYCCPGCHVQVAAEIVRADDPICSEMQLAASGAASIGAGPASRGVE